MSASHTDKDGRISQMVETSESNNLSFPRAAFQCTLVIINVRRCWRSTAKHNGSRDCQPTKQRKAWPHFHGDIHKNIS